MLVFCCYTDFSLVWQEGATLVPVCRLFTVVASHVAEHRLEGTWASQLWRVAQWLRLSGSTAQAQQLWHMGLGALRMWDLPGPGVEPVSSALAGGFFTTEPPGKPSINIFYPACEFPFKNLAGVALNP